MPHRTATKDSLVFYEHLCRLLDDLNIGAFTVNADRKITSLNRAAEVLTSCQEEDVIGKSCHEIFQNEICHGDCKY